MMEREIVVAPFVVAPFEEIEAPVLAHVSAILTETFECRCRIGDRLPVPESAFNARRRQYSAERILQRLEIGATGRTLGVIDRDLYVPDLNFVFGLADTIGRRAVIALPRLRQRFYGLADDEPLFLERVAKEAVHELGHTYGLGHCRNRRCVMAFSNSLADTDYKGKQFCLACWGLAIRQVRDGQAL
jgi:archaemetzincin